MVSVLNFEFDAITGAVVGGTSLSGVSGKEDPVGDFGTGVELVEKQFRAVGMEKVTRRLYDTDRHVILNETDRDAVYEDLYRWLRECLDCP